jgi:hypothetical protein
LLRYHPAAEFKRGDEEPIKTGIDMLAQVISFPHFLVVDDHEKYVANSGKSCAVIGPDHYIADTLRENGEPELIVCDFSRFNELKNLARSVEEFSYLKQTPIILIYGQRPDHALSA